MAKSTKTRVSQSAIANHERGLLAALITKLGLGKKMAAPTKRLLARGAAAPPEFVEAAASAWDAHGKDVGVKSFDADSAREAIAFRAAQQAVLEDARGLVTLLEERVLAHYGPAGRQSFDLYAAIKVAARDDENQALKDKRDGMAEILRKERETARALKEARKAQRQARKTATRVVTAGVAGKSTPDVA